MKKKVLTFGLISGAIVSVLMLATVPFIYQIGFDYGMVIGYTTIVLAFLLVFFGIWSYREHEGDGSITFGRAVAVGLLISLISSICYVVTWEIIYYNFLPDFVDKYTSYMVEKARAGGATQQAIDATIQEMKSMKGYLDNPLINAAIAFIEPFPIGLIITLISAAILRKKPRLADRDENMGAALTSS